MLDLDAIEARVDRATEGSWNADGPWYPPEGDDCYPLVSAGKSRIAVAAIVREYDGPWYPQRSADLAFIAHARTDVPALVAESRAAREVVEAAVDLAERDGHKDDLCDDCGLGGHTSPCPWQSLDTSLAAYRAVVGEQG